MSNIPPRKFRNYRFGYGVNRPIPLYQTIQKQNDINEIASDSLVPPQVLNAIPTKIGLNTLTTIMVYGAGFNADMHVHGISRTGTLTGEVAIGDTGEVGVELEFTYISSTRVTIKVTFPEYTRMDICVITDLGFSIWSTEIGMPGIGVSAGTPAPDVPDLNVTFAKESTEEINGLLTSMARPALGFTPKIIGDGNICPKDKLRLTARVELGYRPAGFIIKNREVNLTQGMDELKLTSKLDGGYTYRRDITTVTGNKTELYTNSIVELGFEDITIIGGEV